MRHKRGPAALPIYGNVATNKRPAAFTLLHFWLRERGISLTAFARTVGCDVKTLEFWCTGRCLPSLTYAFAIEKATEGGVSAATWLGTPIGKMLWARIEERVARK